MANCEYQIITQTKVVSQCFVKPKYKTKASKQPYFLGPSELAFLPFDQLQKGLLFSTKPKNVQSDLLETLKDAIAISLVHFYPLAGRFSIEEFHDENTKWVYLDCNKGPGAGLVHATVEETVSNIVSSVDVHPIVRSFFDLGEKSVNYDGHTRPLVSVQVTELIDGIFIGFTMNHSLVDGNSQWHFINSLSEIFIQLTKNQEIDNIPNISQNPIFKPYFPDGRGPMLKLPKTNKVYIAGCNDRIRERIFHFSSDSIRKLKTEANEEAGVHNISSFQALSGFIWRSITRARNLEPELETCCGLAIDARPRFSPPLSNDYFANLILRQQSICKVGDLLEKGLGWAAMLLHEVVVNLDDKKVREYYEWRTKVLCDSRSVASIGPPFYSPNLVMIGGSARFNIYGPQFGLGKAEAVLAGYCRKEDGKIAASPGREGGGSIDLEICLKPETMKCLEFDSEFMSFVTLA
ncbi:putative acetyltransferase At3g50280 [Silene latifolia]|uniref:putative acetyltransferase At3g50280 n=1 Tax=Silene latifolia TaxID=37657 RepID=UPI003D774CC3